MKDFPSLEFTDISNYLIVQTSFCTAKQMKSFKSFEIYNFFVCGWVHDLGIKVLKDSKVMYLSLSFGCHGKTLSCKQTSL